MRITTFTTHIVTFGVQDILFAVQNPTLNSSCGRLPTLLTTLNQEAPPKGAGTGPCPNHTRGTSFGPYLAHTLEGKNMATIKLALNMEVFLPCGERKQFYPALGVTLPTRRKQLPPPRESDHFLSPPSICLIRSCNWAYGIGALPVLAAERYQTAQYKRRDQGAGAAIGLKRGSPITWYQKSSTYHVSPAEDDAATPPQLLYPIRRRNRTIFV